MVMVHTFTYPTVMYQNTFIYLYMLRDGPLCFDGGRGWGGWKIFTCNIFLYKAPAANNFFCVSLSSYFSVFIASANNSLQNLPPPPPPQKILVRPLTPNLLESPPQKLLILGSSGLLLVISAWKLLLPFL